MTFLKQQQQPGVPEPGPHPVSAATALFLLVGSQRAAKNIPAQLIPRDVPSHPQPPEPGGAGPISPKSPRTELSDQQELLAPGTREVTLTAPQAFLHLLKAARPFPE